MEYSLLEKIAITIACNGEDQINDLSPQDYWDLVFTERRREEYRDLARKVLNLAYSEVSSKAKSAEEALYFIDFIDPQESA